MMTFNKDECEALYIGRKKQSTQMQWWKWCYKKAKNFLGSLQSIIKALTKIKRLFPGISL